MCCLVLLASPRLVAADTAAEARAWLGKMSRAASALSYHGTFVYRTAERLESLRIVHRSSLDGERERLVSTSGEAREVLRDAERVLCILPSTRSVVVAKRRPQAVGATRVLGVADGFDRHYRLSMAGDGRVAGRDTRTVLVEPLDAYRYGYRLSADRSSGLLLKSELRSYFGRTLEQVMYTSIEFVERIPDAALEPESAAEELSWYREDDLAAPSEGLEGWDVAWLPDGFVPSARTDRSSTPTERRVAHGVFTDGLASVSVFIEPSGSQTHSGLSTIGAVNSFGVVRGGFQITVLGEVPARTVERIGLSVRRR